jgi:hypothetical protein
MASDAGRRRCSNALTLTLLLIFLVSCTKEDKSGETTAEEIADSANRGGNADTTRLRQLAASIIPSNLLAHNNDAITFEMIRKECGHTVETIDSAAIQLNMVGPATEIPEYHDCQRMILQDPAHRDGVYGQLVAIYATQQDQPKTPQADSAYLLAEILNYGPKSNSGHTPDYKPLGIPYGASCLYGQLHSKSAQAWIVPLGERIDCKQNSLALSSIKENALELRRDEVEGASMFEYPNVAKWDWDDTRKEQYIGVECGNAWCEIGKPGFTSSVVPTWFPPELSRVKGWYDAQRLAVTMDDGSLAPTNVIGYAVPTALLDQKEPTDFGTGVQAVMLTMSGNNGTYSRKYSMGPGKFSTILVKGTNTQGLHRPWQANFSGGSSAVIGRKVTYTAHPLGSLRLRGTARWHWSEVDETVWVSCINGCCQVEPN